MVARSPERVHAARGQVLQPRYGGLANNTRLSANLGERGLERLLSVLSDGLLFLGPRNAIRYMNAAALDLFGPGAQSLLTNQAFEAGLTRLRSRDRKAPYSFSIELSARMIDPQQLGLVVFDWTAGGGWIVVVQVRASTQGRPLDDQSAHHARLPEE